MRDLETLDNLSFLTERINWVLEVKKYKASRSLKEQFNQSVSFGVAGSYYKPMNL